MIHLEDRAASGEISSFSCENEFLQVPYKWNQLQKDLGIVYINMPHKLKCWLVNVHGEVFLGNYGL